MKFKKSLVLVSSLFFPLAGCQKESLLVPSSELQINQVQINSTNDIESENIINQNQRELEAVSRNLFAQYFADEVEVISKNSGVVPPTKGGMLFNILNKSKLAQKLGYLVANHPVKAKFNKHGIADNVPRINAEQTKNLLSVLKPGDLILCGNDDSFIHAILYIGNGVIIHSLASNNPKYWGVIKENLTQYLSRSERDKFVVLRYKKINQTEFSKSISFAEQQVGKPYDTLFLLNSDTKFYCTELVYQAIMQMGNAPRILPHKEKMGWQLITNEDFMDSPDLETVWTLNKKRANPGVLHKY